MDDRAVGERDHVRRRGHLVGAVDRGRAVGRADHDRARGQGGRYAVRNLAQGDVVAGRSGGMGQRGRHHQGNEDQRTERARDQSSDRSWHRPNLCLLPPCTPTRRARPGLAWSTLIVLASADRSTGPTHVAPLGPALRDPGARACGSARPGAAVTDKSRCLSTRDQYLRARSNRRTARMSDGRWLPPSAIPSPPEIESAVAESDRVHGVVVSAALISKGAIESGPAAGLRRSARGDGGGEAGIRTQGRLAPSAVFKTAALPIERSSRARFGVI
jgi:hypothetical protein